ncbi:hypothetical protein EDF58_106456 [Novosphingobium sp. PhB57]|jgi:hypothetical protein|nr:hypothetical protein EDF58_106456 [Novosphingobium sp. PhB57]
MERADIQGEAMTIESEGLGTALGTEPGQGPAAPLWQALAREMRVARELLEQLAGVLVNDERFVLDYIDQLQAFDLIAQHVDESAALLDRVAGGQSPGEAIGQVRLSVMQDRLRAALD